MVPGYLEDFFTVGDGGNTLPMSPGRPTGLMRDLEYRGPGERLPSSRPPSSRSCPSALGVAPETLSVFRDPAPPTPGRD